MSKEDYKRTLERLIGEVWMEEARIAEVWVHSNAAKQIAALQDG
jgi:SOS response regulatory protein OraA/RecX